MASPEERAQKFKRHVEALNKQFLEWCTSQIASKPTSLLAAGVQDYARHAAKLRLEYSDVISEPQEDRKSSSEHTLNGRTYAPLLSLMPICYTKTIHFIRHGEGWHNVGLANMDAHLTSKGWQQSRSLRIHMQNHEITRNVQLVVVSPLMRALETAAGVFGYEGGDGDRVLMLAQKELPEVRASQPQLKYRSGISFIANELCRERLGPSSCDARRPISESSLSFPGIDFSLMDSDKDNLWRPGKVEPEENVVLRGRQFLQWLMSRTEINIAVVTHSAFLWFTLSGFGSENIRPVRETIQRWYENGEMRTLVVGDGGSQVISSVAFDVDFKGGHAFAEPQQALMESNNNSNEVI